MKCCQLFLDTINSLPLLDRFFRRNNSQMTCISSCICIIFARSSQKKANVFIRTLFFREANGKNISHLTFDESCAAVSELLSKLNRKKVKSKKNESTKPAVHSEETKQSDSPQKRARIAENYDNEFRSLIAEVYTHTDNV